MKLSELSRRDYFALDILNGLCSTMPADLLEEISNGTRGGAPYVNTAYALADKMLEVQEATDRRVEHAEERATKAEQKFDALQSIHVNMQGEGFAGARIALTEIWEFLEVDNQTECMALLRSMAKDTEAHLFGRGSEND